MTTEFSGYGLHPSLLQSIERVGFKTPTPIQAQAIPAALKGHDIMGSAQTGTGKTGAFAIPMINMLLQSPTGTALILAPTRELAQQIVKHVQELIGNKSPLKTALIIGGESMGKQLQQLRQNPRIIIGTPGRINDHLARKSLRLSDTSLLILDETDRMLDMGFGPQLDKIVAHLPAKRQTLMFSATLPQLIIKLAQKYMKEPVRVSVGETNKVAQNLKQEVIRVREEAKYDELMNQLEDRQGSVIIFVKTKYGTEKLAKKLNGDGHASDAIHGDLRQSRRDRVIRDFRAEKYRILVATDVAARGLDIPHIEHVINYHLPQVPEDYIHRIGRTARAGAEGSSLCLVSPEDGRQWNAIERLLNPELARSAPYKKPGGPSSKSKANVKGGGFKKKRFYAKDRYAA